MANIVNTPIVMYVDGHNLVLDESTASELIENNKYDIKIYTNENLDSNQLIKKSENDQILDDSNKKDLTKEVKRLLRSKEESSQQWWVYLEKIDDENYGGILKTYTYEEVPTVFLNKKRRDRVLITELGDLEVKLNDDFDGIVSITPKFTTDIDLSGGILTTDFQNIPEPLPREIKVEFPSKIKLLKKDPTDPTDPTNPTDPIKPIKPIKPTEPTEPTEPTALTLNLNDYSNSFNLGGVNGGTIDISTLTFDSYSKEEGIYYYSQTFAGTLFGITLKNSISGAKTYDVAIVARVECKINENNFNDFSLTVFLDLEAQEEPVATAQEEPVATAQEEPVATAQEEPEELGNLSDWKESISTEDDSVEAEEIFKEEIPLKENLEIDLEVSELSISLPGDISLKVITEEFDMEEIFLQETGDDYSNIYIVKDFEIDSYNNSGLNEIALGVIGTNYETNSVILTVAPGVKGTSWPVTTLLRKVYITETKLSSTATVPTPTSTEFSIQEVDSLYIQKVYRKNTATSKYDPNQIKLYLWSPVESSFKEFEIGEEESKITPIDIPTS